VTHEETTKRELLSDIERLIAYGKEEPVINPALLRYLSVEELENIKAKLIERVGKLDEEDKAWLQRFKKEA
jgi:hypothetical protein